MGKSESVYLALDQILNDADKNINEALDKTMAEGMKMAKNDVQAASPGGGEYRQGWKIKTTKVRSGFAGVVYNAAKPGLTHLLENSHIIKNQYGEYERTNPDRGYGGKKHIEPAARAAEAFVEREIMTRLNNL